MRKKPTSIDGFVPRRHTRSVGTAFEPKNATGRSASWRPVEGGRTLQSNEASQDTMSARPISRRDIDESLSGITDEQPTPKKRRFFGRRRTKKPLTTRRKVVKRLVLILIVIALAIAAFVGIKAFIASNAIFKGNLFGIFLNKPLKMDANGRTNVLVYGTSGTAADTDKPAYEQHPGAQLTDTIMVLSVDQNKKNAYMVSLPRDLYVDYGAACNSGYQGKINELYNCYSDAGSNDKAGAKALEKKVTEVTGLTIQYYAHINWAVVTESIDAVGGITVNVQGNGGCTVYGLPEYSVYDVNMNFRYTPGKHHMSGAEALKFSRARGSAGGCGLNRGDYDRQANQQKVLKALREKAASAGTLTNIGKVTALIDALGNNLRTDFATSEIRTLMSLGQAIPSDKIISIDLVSAENDLIVGEMLNGASIQVPQAGMYEYSEIKAYIHKKITANAITRENAHVAIFNATQTNGYAQTQADTLTQQGFTITAVQNAPSGSYDSVVIYQLTDGHPATKKKLAAMYSAQVQSGQPPFSVSSDTDFVVILGVVSSPNSQ